jgi:integrase
MRGDGRVYKRGNRWWVEYWVRGKQFREPGGANDREARRKLKDRMKEIHGDRFVGPKMDRLTVVELLDNLELHQETKGAKAIPSLKSHLKPVRSFFALTRAVDLTATQVERYVKTRMEAKKAPATINREVGALKQALNLARKQGCLLRVPYIPRLKEDNARQGFFEKDEFEAVAAHLPPPINDVARFAFLSGWRRGEILPLRWDAVDRTSREVRLRTSKTGHGRVLPLDGELWDLMERRWAAREYKTRDRVTRLSDYVFHRRGKRIVDFKKAWVKACEEAKVPGGLFHDLRRTAVRNMVRASVPQSVAMAISGHRTHSMFLRYNITSGDDMRQAIRRTQAHLSTMSGKRKVFRMPARKRG